jgi:ADP-ribose pyrophosphatase
MNPDASRVAYDGKLFDVTVERWGDHEREVVEHPGAVAIVAVDRDGMVTLVRQRREAVRAVLVELPAGTLEQGETPLECAQRELAEETGLTGGTWGRSHGLLHDAGLLPRAHASLLRTRPGARVGEPGR